MKSSKVKILFFIADSSPTDAERDAADKLASTRTQVVFRNASQVSPGDGVERCDKVAGCVPAPYSKLPRADEEEAAEEIPPAPEPIVAPVAAPVATEEPAPEAPAPEPVAHEVDENSTKSEIMEALNRRGLRFSTSANKAELLAILRE